MNDELDEIRKRRLEEFQKAQQEQALKQQQEEMAKSQIEEALRQVLTQEAWDQWNNAKIANEDNAYGAAIAIIKSAQTGNIEGKLSVEQVKQFLSAVSKYTRRDWNIKFK